VIVTTTTRLAVEQARAPHVVAARGLPAGRGDRSLTLQPDRDGDRRTGGSRQ
jgi:hypothetical protein